MSVLSILQHEMNLTNQNFVSIRAENLSVQSLIFETVVGNAKYPSVTILPPRSQKTVKSFIIQANYVKNQMPYTRHWKIGKKIMNKSIKKIK